MSGTKPDSGIPIPQDNHTTGARRSHRRLQSKCQKLSGKAIETWRKIMEDGDAPYKDRIRAAELIIAYGYGRPLQQAEMLVTGQIGHEVVEIPLGLRQKMDEILELHPKELPPPETQH